MAKTRFLGLNRLRVEEVRQGVQSFLEEWMEKEGRPGGSQPGTLGRRVFFVFF